MVLESPGTVCITYILLACLHSWRFHWKTTKHSHSGMQADSPNTQKYISKMINWDKYHYQIPRSILSPLASFLMFLMLAVGNVLANTPANTTELRLISRLYSFIPQTMITNCYFLTFTDFLLNMFLILLTYSPKLVLLSLSILTKDCCHSLNITTPRSSDYILSLTPMSFFSIYIRILPNLPHLP